MLIGWKYKWEVNLFCEMNATTEERQMIQNSVNKKHHEEHFHLLLWKKGILKYNQLTNV